MAILRGASVGADSRLVARTLAGLSFVAIAVAALVLLVAAIHKNDQINRLHSQGVPVEMTVTGCRGLVGGSGSNLVGYQCRGKFVLSGRQHVEDIPGSVFRAPGTKFRAEVAQGDPALLAPASVADSEHASARPFVLPATLLLLLAVAVPAVVLRKRATGSFP